VDFFLFDCEAAAGQVPACHIYAAVAVHDTMNHCVSINHSVLYNMAWVTCTTKQCVCLVQLYFKHESARKCHRKFQLKFPGEPVPSRQNIHYLVNKLKTRRSLLDKKSDRKRTPHTPGEQRNMRREISAISGEEIQSGNNVFCRYTVHSIRRGTFSASALALVSFSYTF
jgi:hypothetical protein